MIVIRLVNKCAMLVKNDRCHFEVSKLSCNSPNMWMIPAYVHEKSEIAPSVLSFTEQVPQEGTG